MRIAFYAPLKAPAHPVPSGDRLMARQLLRALELAEHAPFVVSEFRSYDGAGDPQRQQYLRAEAAAEVDRLIDLYTHAPERKPQVWFTYHLYYKAPDWLGLPVCEALQIPYVVAEPSFAPKRADGPWRRGHEDVADALRGASVTLCLTRYDMEYVAPQVSAPEHRLLFLPPFIDATPFAAASQARTKHRAALATALNLSVEATWLITVAMMRPGDKLASYRQLADALTLLDSRDAGLLIVGDGPARADVEAALQGLQIPVRFLGKCDKPEIASALAASDLYVWPAVGEAYGMALLEAQAAGLPVVAAGVRGVVDVVVDGQTGLLTKADDAVAMAGAIARLLDDADLRRQLGTAACEFVTRERDLGSAASLLRRAVDLAVA